MLKIATHDSETGEKPTWWSLPLTPFARTQSKSIKEQLYIGARRFDIRVKKVFGKWRCAHGWWFTKREFSDIMDDIVSFTRLSDENVSLEITFEGKTKKSGEFTEYIKGNIGCNKCSYHFLTYVCPDIEICFIDHSLHCRKINIRKPR